MIKMDNLTESVKKVLTEISKDSDVKIEQLRRISFLLQYQYAEIQPLNLSLQKPDYATFISNLIAFMRLFIGYFENNTFPVDNLFKVFLDDIAHFFEIEQLGEKLMPVIEQYMESILDPSVEFWTCYELVVSFESILTKVNTEIKTLFFTEHTINLYKLMDNLYTCGDYGFQEKILRLIFELLPDKKCNRQLAYHFFPDDKHLEEELHKVEQETFDVDCRTFLNNVNAKTLTVISIKAKSVFGDSVHILPPSFFENEEDIWVDFNSKSESISIQCSVKSFSDDVFANKLHDTIFVNKSIIKSINVKSMKRQQIIIVNLIGDVTMNTNFSESFKKKCRVVNILLEKTLQQKDLVGSYLPKIFGSLFLGNSDPSTEMDRVRKMRETPVFPPPNISVRSTASSNRTSPSDKSFSMKIRYEVSKEKNLPDLSDEPQDIAQQNLLVSCSEPIQDNQESRSMLVQYDTEEHWTLQTNKQSKEAQGIDRSMDSLPPTQHELELLTLESKSLQMLSSAQQETVDKTEMASAKLDLLDTSGIAEGLVKVSVPMKQYKKISNTLCTLESISEDEEYMDVDVNEDEVISNSNVPIAQYNDHIMDSSASSCGSDTLNEKKAKKQSLPKTIDLSTNIDNLHAVKQFAKKTAQSKRDNVDSLKLHSDPELKSQSPTPLRDIDTFKSTEGTDKFYFAKIDNTSSNERQTQNFYSAEMDNVNSNERQTENFYSAEMDNANSNEKKTETQFESFDGIVSCAKKEPKNLILGVSQEPTNDTLGLKRGDPGKNIESQKLKALTSEDASENIELQKSKFRRVSKSRLRKSKLSKSKDVSENIEPQKSKLSKSKNASQNIESQKSKLKSANESESQKLKLVNSRDASDNMESQQSKVSKSRNVSEDIKSQKSLVENTEESINFAEDTKKGVDYSKEIGEVSLTQLLTTPEEDKFEKTISSQRKKQNINKDVYDFTDDIHIILNNSSLDSFDHFARGLKDKPQDMGSRELKSKNRKKNESHDRLLDINSLDSFNKFVEHLQDKPQGMSSRELKRGDLEITQNLTSNDGKTWKNNKEDTNHQSDISDEIDKVLRSTSLDSFDKFVDGLRNKPQEVETREFPQLSTSDDGADEINLNELSQLTNEFKLREQIDNDLGLNESTQSSSVVKTRDRRAKVIKDYSSDEQADEVLIPYETTQSSSVVKTRNRRAEVIQDYYTSDEQADEVLIRNETTQSSSVVKMRNRRPKVIQDYTCDEQVDDVLIPNEATQSSSVVKTRNRKAKVIDYNDEQTDKDLVTNDSPLRSSVVKMKHRRAKVIDDSNDEYLPFGNKEVLTNEEKTEKLQKKKNKKTIITNKSNYEDGVWKMSLEADKTLKIKNDTKAKKVKGSKNLKKRTKKCTNENQESTKMDADENEDEETPLVIKKEKSKPTRKLRTLTRKSLNEDQDDTKMQTCESNDDDEQLDHKKTKKVPTNKLTKYEGNNKMDYNESDTDDAPEAIDNSESTRSKKLTDNTKIKSEVQSIKKGKRKSSKKFDVFEDEENRKEIVVKLTDFTRESKGNKKNVLQDSTNVINQNVATETRMALENFTKKTRTRQKKGIPNKLPEENADLRSVLNKKKLGKKLELEKVEKKKVNRFKELEKENVQNKEDTIMEVEESTIRCKSQDDILKINSNNKNKEADVQKNLALSENANECDGDDLSHSLNLKTPENITYAEDEPKSQARKYERLSENFDKSDDFSPMLDLKTPEIVTLEDKWQNFCDDYEDTNIKMDVDKSLVGETPENNVICKNFNNTNTKMEVSFLNVSFVQEEKSRKETKPKKRGRKKKTEKTDDEDMKVGLFKGALDNLKTAKQPAQEDFNLEKYQEDKIVADLISSHRKRELLLKEKQEEQAQDKRAIVENKTEVLVVDVDYDAAENLENKYATKENNKKLSMDKQFVEKRIPDESTNKSLKDLTKKENSNKKKLETRDIEAIFEIDDDVDDHRRNNDPSGNDVRAARIQHGMGLDIRVRRGLNDSSLSDDNAFDHQVDKRLLKSQKSAEQHIEKRSNLQDDKNMQDEIVITPEDNVHDDVEIKQADNNQRPLREEDEKIQILDKGRELDILKNQKTFDDEEIFNCITQKLPEQISKGDALLNKKSLDQKEVKKDVMLAKNKAVLFSQKSQGQKKSCESEIVEQIKDDRILFSQKDINKVDKMDQIKEANALEDKEGSLQTNKVVNNEKTPITGSQEICLDEDISIIEPVKAFNRIQNLGKQYINYIKNFPKPEFKVPPLRSSQSEVNLREMKSSKRKLYNPEDLSHFYPSMSPLTDVSKTIQNETLTSTVSKRKHGDIDSESILSKRKQTDLESIFSKKQKADPYNFDDDGDSKVFSETSSRRVEEIFKDIYDKIKKPKKGARGSPFAVPRKRTMKKGGSGTRRIVKYSKRDELISGSSKVQILQDVRLGENDAAVDEFGEIIRQIKSEKEKVNSLFNKFEKMVLNFKTWTNKSRRDLNN